MTQQELDEIFLIYATGAADAAESAQAEALLASGAPQAQAAYAEALAVVNALPLALDRVEPPAGLRDRVMARIGESAHAAPASLPIRPRPIWPAYTATALAACLAIALTASLVSLRHAKDRTRTLLSEVQSARTELDRTQTSLQMSDAQLASARSSMDQLKSRLARATRTINDARSVLRSPTVSLASMEEKPAGHGYGRVLYCSETRQYQVMVFDMKPPPPGKVYELWLITPDNKKLPAGTFTLDQTGSGTVMAHAPQGVKVSLAALTDEPEGGVDVPTGTVQLAGALQASPLTAPH